MPRTLDNSRKQNVRSQSFDQKRAKTRRVLCGTNCGCISFGTLAGWRIAKLHVATTTVAAPPVPPSAPELAVAQTIKVTLKHIPNHKGCIFPPPRSKSTMRDCAFYGGGLAQYLLKLRITPHHRSMWVFKSKRDAATTVANLHQLDSCIQCLITTNDPLLVQRREGPPIRQTSRELIGA